MLTLPFSFFQGFDTNAAAFISAAGLTNPTEISAINTLVVDLKEADLWNKIVAFYPFINATQNKWNLKNPQDTNAAWRLTFSNGWTMSSLGATPNGTSAYADTHLQPGTSGAGNNSTHIAVYSGSNSALGNATDIGVSAGAGASYIPILWLRAKNSTNAKAETYQYDYSQATQSIEITNAVATGFYVSNRNSATVLNLWKNGVKLATATGTNTQNITTVTESLYLGAGNLGGTASQFSNRQLRAASIGTGLTDAEAVDLYNIVQTYQTTLGRNV